MTIGVVKRLTDVHLPKYPQQPAIKGTHIEIYKIVNNLQVETKDQQARKAERS